MSENGKSNGRDDQGRFRPGHSGNIAGRPPGIPSGDPKAAFVRAFGLERVEVDGRSIPRYQLWLEELDRAATQAIGPEDVATASVKRAALQLIFERLDPRPPSTSVTVNNNVSGELRDALQAARDRYLEVHGK